MTQSMIAQRFQTPEENLLMDIATIAKKTPNLIDLSIGDPDLITDQSIIAAAFTDVKMDIQNTRLLMAVPILFKLLSIFIRPIMD